MRSLIFFWVAVIAASMLSVGVSAAPVTMTGDDSGTTSSFNSGANWSDASPPSSGNDYFTGANTLQTPLGAASSIFAGDSLTVDSGGRVYYIGAKNGSITIDNLILNGGKYQTSRVAANDYNS